MNERLLPRVLTPKEFVDLRIPSGITNEACRRMRAIFEGPDVDEQRFVIAALVAVLRGGYENQLGQELSTIESAHLRRIAERTVPYLARNNATVRPTNRAAHELEIDHTFQAEEWDIHIAKNPWLPWNETFIRELNIARQLSHHW